MKLLFIITGSIAVSRCFEILDELKKNKVKICIVSPELVNTKLKNKIKYLKKYLKINNFEIDAVCTKFPNQWDSK